MSERKLFGTDGVRDVANTGRMTPEFALKLGRAFVKSQHIRKIVVGRDTRRSAPMLESALVSGMTSEGAEVFLAGIIPTPAVSYAVHALNADGGAVISASHNTAEYNGIKFLGADGCKLTDEQELDIEASLDITPASSMDIGRIHHAHQLVRVYAQHIASILNCDAAVDNSAFDCAHGASAMSVPFLICNSSFSHLNSHIISRDFDGLNINRDCGVMHMSTLTSYVKANGLNLGFAFDGDADRVLISDKLGRIIDGDIILWVLARWLKSKAFAGSDKVAATVMSNKALDAHLADEGIATLRCPVGDRYVLELMQQTGAALGGEQSGHIIASPFTSTGDGLCTAMLFLNAIHDLDEDPSLLIERFGRYPQKLTNLKLRRSRADLDMKAIDYISNEYASCVKGGRILIRLSGTEPLLRILVEAPDSKLVEQVSGLLAAKLENYC